MAFRLLPSVFVLAESCRRIFEASSVKAELEESRDMGSQRREWEGASGGVLRGSSDSLHGAQPRHHRASW